MDGLLDLDAASAFDVSNHIRYPDLQGDQGHVQHGYNSTSAYNMKMTSVNTLTFSTLWPSVKLEWVLLQTDLRDGMSYALLMVHSQKLLICIGPIPFSTRVYLHPRHWRHHQCWNHRHMQSAGVAHQLSLRTCPQQSTHLYVSASTESESPACWQSVGHQPLLHLSIFLRNGQHFGHRGPPTTRDGLPCVFTYHQIQLKVAQLKKRAAQDQNVTLQAYAANINEWLANYERLLHLGATFHPHYEDYIGATHWHKTWTGDTFIYHVQLA